MTCVLYSCSKDDNIGVVPILESTELNIQNLDIGSIDMNRLCMAEVLIQLFDNQRFSSYFKSKSLNHISSWNNEFLLIKYWNEVIDADRSLKDMIEDVISTTPELCFSNILEFNNALTSDPLLVLKIPDIMPAGIWDVDEVTPFLYTRTHNGIQDPQSNSLITTFLGFNSLGITDYYPGRIPQYFAVVLKVSEDFIGFNKSLLNPYGVDYAKLHSFYDPGITIEVVLQGSEWIVDFELNVIAFNTFVKNLNRSSGEIALDSEIQCADQCKFSCISKEERKLILKNFTIHILDSLHGRQEEFENIYRRMGLIFNDNIIPMLLYSHKPDFFAPGNWRKILLGSHRLNDIFEVSYDVAVNNKVYQINGEREKIPELTLDYEISGLNQIPVDNLLIVNNISEGNNLTVAHYRLFNEYSIEEFTLLDEETVGLFDLYRDGVHNYDLYCFNEETRIGFNSVSLQLSY